MRTVAPAAAVPSTRMDGVLTTAEGALFNHSLALHGDSDFNTDNAVGSAVHNPFLMEALLITSIMAVEDEYGVTSPRAATRARSLKAELQAVLARVPR